jgi:hypothetical protein
MYTSFVVNTMLRGANSVTKAIDVKDRQVKRWMPNGYGEQQLYRIEADVVVEGNILFVP